MPQFHGQDLIHALTTTTALVKVHRADSGEVAKVSAHAALMLIRTGTYVGTGRNHRVRSIREVDTRRPNIADGHFHDGPCRRYDEPVTRKTVDLWDRILQRTPAVA